MIRALVVSSVHPPDDPRIAAKLVPALAGVAEVRYACREPGPSAVHGYAYRALRGGRLRRDLAASRLLLGRSYDVASVHDPELLPAVVIAAVLGRTVVFDLHEDLPAQLVSRPGWPSFAARAAAWAAGRLLRIAERVATVTLAEPRYGRLLRRPARVFPNYLAAPAVSPRRADSGAGVVYLGDVTPARGIDLAVEAVGASGTGLPFDVIGRCRPEFAAELHRLAARHGVDLRLRGYLPLDEALDLVAGSVAGLCPLRDVPNYRHSLPTKVLEYLGVGLPVIASDLPGTAAVVAGRPGAVLVPPADAGALARAVSAVAADPALRAATAAAAEALRAEFVWPGDEVAGFYAALAA